MVFAPTSLLTLALGCIQPGDPDEPPTPAWCDEIAYIDSLALASPPEAATPIDGVVLLSYVGGNGPGTLGLIEATVTLDGDQVPGALERTDFANLLVWRPDVPFEPGATHRFTATLTDVDFVDAECRREWDPIHEHEFTTSIAPPPLTAPVPIGAEALQQFPVIDLDNLACCPGARPTAVAACSGHVYHFDPDVCTPVSVRGSLAVHITGPAAAHVVYTADDGSSPQTRVGVLDFSYIRDAPFCVTVTATDLTHDVALAGPEQCFGADVADQLGGPHPLAPPSSFDCELQQCKPKDDTWDLDKCTPGTGCGCTTTPTPSAPLLALLFLLRRRTRRQ